MKSDGSRLSLRGLLHYLWDQAGLTRWHPGFAGRRSWTTVRRHLLAGADDKVARGDPLRTRLYIPEAFSVEQREVLNARRLAHWSRALPRPGQPTQRLLLLGEVKEIVPARYGYKANIKHVPDQAFALDEVLYQRLERRFEAQLSLWGVADGLHMMAIAAFCLNLAGVPTIDELSLMLVTNQWLSIDDRFDLQLTARLVNDGRSFIKPLRYNLPTSEILPAALLIDCEDRPTALCIEQVGRHAVQDRSIVADGDCVDTPACWWRAADEPLPPLPSLRRGVGASGRRSGSPLPASRPLTGGNCRSGHKPASRLPPQSEQVRWRGCPPIGHPTRSKDGRNNLIFSIYINNLWLLHVHRRPKLSGEICANVVG